MRPAPLLAVAVTALVLMLTGCGTSSPPAAAPRHRPRRTGTRCTLMQMNLCLSGLAACYTAKVKYPGVVDEAIAQIRVQHPDAVSFHEACGGDVARDARQTGSHARFSSIVYYGERLACVRPRGRGLFGDAVLTRAPIARSESHPFHSQAGPEQRQWVCAT